MRSSCLITSPSFINWDIQRSTCRSPSESSCCFHGAGTLGEPGGLGARGGHGRSVYCRMDCPPTKMCARRGLLGVHGDCPAPGLHVNSAPFYDKSLPLLFAALLSDPGCGRTTRGVAGGIDPNEADEPYRAPSLLSIDGSGNPRRLVGERVG